MAATNVNFVLSLFPGVDLFGRGFEAEGFCVVRGPDPVWGGDIREFRPPPFLFGGIIGGSPCQDFSKLRRTEPTGLGEEMLGEFARCVRESSCRWFLLENVPGVPDIRVHAYKVQRLNLRASDCGAAQSRLRCFQFGQWTGQGGIRPFVHPLVIDRCPAGSGLSQPAALATEGRRSNRRSWPEFCALQGLPAGYDLPGMTISGKYRAVGNGVPVQMARVLARAVRAWSVTETLTRVCVCDCGRPVPAGRTLATAGCRKRMERARRDAAGVSGPGPVTAAQSQELAL